MITLKSMRELDRMRRAGSIVHSVLDAMEGWIRPGVRTKELDRRAESLIRERGAEPSFLGYMGYTASICVSVNEEVVHGIPSERVLRDGDLVSVDVGARYQNYHGDAARTFAVGGVSAPARRILEDTRSSLERAIAQVRSGAHLSQIARAVESVARERGYGVVRDYVGHGIGSRLHEDPQVPNFVSTQLLENDVELAEGMVLAIEPMFTLGSHQVRKLDDGWTVVTVDGALAAHFEDTVAVTAEGPEVFTRAPREAHAGREAL
ncbi:MAG: type I methionyl aminopeptidase [Planctomycetes bacterium]|nr:type I methionyl aminopeptidase [Planctomycetota bacterium]